MVASPRPRKWGVHGLRLVTCSRCRNTLSVAMADITGIPALKQGSRFLELGDAVLALASSLVCVWTVSFAISSLARGIDGVLTVLFVIIIALFNWRVRMWLRWKREELADFLDATDSFMFGAAFASILNNLQMLWCVPCLLWRRPQAPVCSVAHACPWACPCCVA